jgi:NitT/TauT family transport system permease protein
MNRTRRNTVAPFLGLALFFGLWESFVRIANVPEFKLPKPSTALHEVWNQRSFFWDNAKPTISAAFMGFIVAVVVAFVIGSLLAHSEFAERAFLPVALLIVVTPLYAYVIAIVLWVGLGFRSLVVAVAIVCFPPVLFATIVGLKSADPLAVDLLKSANASPWEIFRKLRVPAALPAILSATKLSAGLSLVGVTIGEPAAFVDKGVGLLIRKSAAAGNVGGPQLWGSIFVLGFIGSFAYLAISGIESAVRRWHSLGSGQDS